MTTDTQPFDDVAEPELTLPSLDDFIDNPKYPPDEDLPGELRPKRAYRSRKKEKATVQTISEAIVMLNGMFGMAVPCSCRATLPEPLQGIAHRDTCTKLYPLTEEESNALSAAIAAEFEAHPDWVSKLENAGVWMAHAALAACVFSVIMSRRLRSGAILLPPDAPQELQAIATNGVHV